MKPIKPPRDAPRRIASPLSVRPDRRSAYRQERATNAIVQTFARGLVKPNSSTARRAPAAVR
jgi:hypothetical protein